MTHFGYLVLGWGGAMVVLGTYALFLILRGRAVAASVPVDRRRWMTSDDPS